MDEQCLLHSLGSGFRPPGPLVSSQLNINVHKGVIVFACAMVPTLSPEGSQQLWGSLKKSPVVQLQLCGIYSYYRIWNMFGVSSGGGLSFPVKFDSFDVSTFTYRKGKFLCVHLESELKSCTREWGFSHRGLEAGHVANVMWKLGNLQSTSSETSVPQWSGRRLPSSS